MSKPHQKHAKLVRPFEGAWGRHELALLGAPCSVIRELSLRIAAALDGQYKLGFADAAHHNATSEAAMPAGLALQLLEKESYRQTDDAAPLNLFSQRALFDGQDVVLVNGNHFTAMQQIAIIHPEKELIKKQAALTNVALILLAGGIKEAPKWLSAHTAKDCPVLSLNDTGSIAQWLDNYLTANKPPLYGLVLAGGKSSRMGTDKGSIPYHGLQQKVYAYEQLLPLCAHVYISCNREQAAGETLPFLEDTFLGLGPMGGILTAMQHNPKAAWLTVACDLPYLTAATLLHLIAHRNPSKAATAFIAAAGAFPEPLITIWEPRSYPLLLQALSQGYSCPRKVLINNDVALLQAPDAQDMENVNDPSASSQAMQQLQPKTAH